MHDLCSQVPLPCHGSTGAVPWQSQSITIMPGVAQVRSRISIESRTGESGTWRRSLKGGVAQRHYRIRPRRADEHRCPWRWPMQRSQSSVVPRGSGSQFPSSRPSHVTARPSKSSADAGPSFPPLVERILNRDGPQHMPNQHMHVQAHTWRHVRAGTHVHARMCTHACARTWPYGARCRRRLPAPRWSPGRLRRRRRRGRRAPARRRARGRGLACGAGGGADTAAGGARRRLGRHGGLPDGPLARVDVAARWGPAAGAAVVKLPWVCPGGVSLKGTMSIMGGVHDPPRSPASPILARKARPGL